MDEIQVGNWLIALSCLDLIQIDSDRFASSKVQVTSHHLSHRLFCSYGRAVLLSRGCPWASEGCSPINDPPPGRFWWPQHDKTVIHQYSSRNLLFYLLGCCCSWEIWIKPYWTILNHIKAMIYVGLLGDIYNQSSPKHPWARWSPWCIKWVHGQQRLGGEPKYQMN